MTTGTRPESGAAEEAYRILRSSVKYAAGETPVRSVLVVDLDRPEPSGVARQLALAFARGGDPCVLVETDPRRPAERGAGFSDLAMGAAERATAVQPGGAPGFAIVGPGTASQPDLLAGDGVAAALDQLLADHRHVVLSCASLPAHGDALALAPRVDATILVVTSGRTRRPRAVEARDALERVGARLLGVVMVETKRRLFW